MVEADKLIEEIRAGLEGVTPFLDTDMMRYEHGGGRLAILRDGERRLVADFYHEEDREHFARQSPDNWRTIFAYVDGLKAELATLRSAQEAVRERAAQVADEHAEFYSDAFKKMTRDKLFDAANIYAGRAVVAREIAAAIRSLPAKQEADRAEGQGDV